MSGLPGTKGDDPDSSLTLRDSRNEYEKKRRFHQTLHSRSIKTCMSGRGLPPKETPENVLINTDLCLNYSWVLLKFTSLEFDISFLLRCLSYTSPNGSRTVLKTLQWVVWPISPKHTVWDERPDGNFIFLYFDPVVFLVWSSDRKVSSSLLRVSDQKLVSDPSILCSDRPMEEKNYLI